MSEILQVSSDRGHWVFTFVPAGETINVRDKDVGNVPFVKDYDVVQGHVVNGDQFMKQTAVTRFLKDTEGLSPAKHKQYFGVKNDGLSTATLEAVRKWLKDPNKGHKMTGA